MTDIAELSKGLRLFLCCECDVSRASEKVLSKDVARARL